MTKLQPSPTDATDVATVANRRKPAGKQPARSEAEWWNAQRTAAFETLRLGKTPDVPPRTLDRWQADPRWQARLKKRDDKREAAAIDREIERSRLLEEGCDDALRAWREIVNDPASDRHARISAGRELWSLKLKLDAQAQQRTQGRIWELSFSAEVWE